MPSPKAVIIFKVPRGYFPPDGYQKYFNVSVCNTLQLGTLNHTYMKAVAAAVIVETPEVCKLCGTWWWMFGGEGRWGHLKGENGMAMSGLGYENHSVGSGGLFLLF